MRRTLLDHTSVNLLEKRVQLLRRDSVARWGRMNATEMLLHCTLANGFILDDKSAYIKPSLRNRLIKFVALHLLSKFPKNRSGPQRLQVKGSVDSVDFEQQKGAYVATLRRFLTHAAPFTSIHPGMGYLNNEEWGRVAWMHMDHHLRQFGV